MSILLKFLTFFLLIVLVKSVEVPDFNKTAVDEQGRSRPPVDIHSLDTFNLTEWIETYPNEKEELKEWKTHLMEHADASMKSLRDNVLERMYSLWVLQYFQIEKTPIQLSDIEFNDVAIKSMKLIPGQVRRSFMENYRDPNFETWYWGFSAFYEDMESVSVTFEDSNSSEIYYVWGINYNKTQLHHRDWEYPEKEIFLEVSKIYVKKWETHSEAIIKPKNIIIKKFVYQLKVKDIYCRWSCYYGDVKEVLEAHVSHSINTGRTKEKTWKWVQK